MQILHIWDQAGVACIIAKYQQLQGHNSKVIRISGYDPYGINNFYKNYIFHTRAVEYIEKCIEMAKPADIVHVHSRIDILFELRKKYGSSKKIILHYHGTDIRGSQIHKQQTPHSLLSLTDILLKSKRIAKRMLFSKSKKQIHIEAQKLADIVIVSTPDLLELVPKGVYLPNPIDIDHFNQNRISKKNEQKEALIINTEVTNISCALDYCKKHNINLDIEIHDRISHPIMYHDMPYFLKKYKTFIDIRFVNKTLLENLSKTALEALACGLKVLDYRLQYHQGLPSQHNPMNVVSHLSTIYCC
jgi:glycosyltransferase involved in cell wall biosynthesis